MSLAAINRIDTKEEQIDWARLIPGEAPLPVVPGKKRPHSVRACAGKEHLRTSATETVIRRSHLALFEPRPLQSRMGWRWLRSVAADWALVSLNWLIVGALLVPLRELFPRVWSFGYAAGAPIYLLGAAVLHAALITLIGYTEGLDVSGADLRRQGHILAKSVSCATLLLCVAYGLQGAPWTISGLICAAGLLHFGALWIWRWRLPEYERPARVDARNVVIIGAGAAGRHLADCISEQPVSSRRVCGFLDDQWPLGEGVLGRIADLARIARKEFVDEIILAAPRDRNVIRWVVSEARRLRLDVEIVPDLFGCDPVGEEIERVGDLPLICLHAEQFPAGALFVKRLLDTLMAATALIVLSPVLIVTAILIRLDSPGPVLYCAPRAGRKATLFRCYKFRTMVSNADELKIHLRQSNQRAGPFFKISGDPRITRIGRLLRRYSLDELPQLWNVIRGEMSLVGPRPPSLDEVASYEIEYLGRLDVSPGITGLWQVTARRDPSFHRTMELDREYIRTWSLGLDARILVKTLWVVVQGSGE